MIFLKKNIPLVDLSARKVYPRPMFSLRCNFKICKFGKFKFWVELFLRIKLRSYIPASCFSGVLRISRIADLQH